MYFGGKVLWEKRKPSCVNDGEIRDDFIEFVSDLFAPIFPSGGKSVLVVSQQEGKRGGCR